MSRQLKFRVWSPLNQKVLPCYSFNTILKNRFLIGYSEDFDKVFFLEDKDAVIQQFTGLQDKNGKDIYEGDIILNYIDHDEIRPVLCVVGWSVYEEIGFATFYPQKEVMEPLKQNFNGVDLYEEYPMCYGRGHGYEVLGNIFENPELLQKLA